MYRSDLDTDQGQIAFMDQLLADGDEDFEFRVREIADGLVKNENTYGLGSLITFAPPYRNYDPSNPMPLPPVQSVQSVKVRLHPWLARRPRVAALIAEHIIRDALVSARLEADCRDLTAT